jgi:hypothetical protein
MLVERKDDRMNEDTKRKKIRSYFSRSHPGIAVVFVLFGVIVAGLSIAAGRGAEPGIAVGVLLLAASLLWFFVAIMRQIKRPSDEQMDRWLAEDLKQIVERSINKLGLVGIRLMKGDDDTVMFTGPILWTTSGISNKDLLWKKGKDDIVRFAIYRVTIIQLAEHLLAAYACDFNFLKNVKLNEDTDEYHYRDIASVSTHEISTSYRLPNGKSLVHAQAFRLSVVSGESIQVTIGAEKLEKLTGGTIPTTGAETAVQVIRTMLREKKK